MGNTTSPADVGQAIGQAIGGAMIILWVIVIVLAILGIALLVWFIWAITRIKNENTKTNKLLNDLNKTVSRLSAQGKPSAGEPVLVSDELAKYKGLLDSGAITEEEYNLKKIQLLNK